MRNAFCFAVISLVAFSVGCKKESNNLYSSALPAPVVQLSNNSVGGVSAGRDIYIDLPETFCLLRGSVQNRQNIYKVLWSKLSGPPFGDIQNPDSIETRLTDLSKGNYQFELLIIDKANVAFKDTIAVIVSENGDGVNELMFPNLRWSCPMGCHLRIENFQSYFPANISFRVFVKRDDSTQWIEAFEIHRTFSKYMWTIYNNGLEILEDQTELDPNDTPDIKIIF